MARLKTEPFQWAKQDGVLTQSMLREYIRWLFPQLGRAYEPPRGVIDYTAAARSRLEGKQPPPFRPRKASGVVLRSDLERFAAYCFEALQPFSDQRPYRHKPATCLAFVLDLKKLNQHLLDLIMAKRRAEQSN